MEPGVTSEIATAGGGISLVGILGWVLKAVYGDQRAFRKEIRQRLDEQDQEISSHALLDAQTFVTKDEFGDLRQHIDNKLSEQTNLIINVITGSNKR